MYVYLRPDTGCYAFRWTIPAVLRPLVGDRRDVRKSLQTDDKRTALRLARHLRVVLERATISLMAKRSQEQLVRLHDLKLFERLINGTVRIEGLTMDPDPARAEEDRKHLAALLGTAATANAPADERTLVPLETISQNAAVAGEHHAWIGAPEIVRLFPTFVWKSQLRPEVYGPSMNRC
jgi:hypothetical protein